MKILKWIVKLPIRLFRFFFWRTKHFPRWFHESVQGNIKSRLGQDLSPSGELEIVVQFQSRANFGKWETIGQFRYVDVASMKFLFQETEKYLRSLITND